MAPDCVTHSILIPNINKLLCVINSLVALQSVPISMELCQKLGLSN